jgi:hypothetical protein
MEDDINVLKQNPLHNSFLLGFLEDLGKNKNKLGLSCAKLRTSLG